MADAKTTIVHLQNWIGDIIKDNGLTVKMCAFRMYVTFGKDIHSQIDGFINFATDTSNGIDPHDIKATLVHDLGGALSNDDMMTPRVSDYARFSK